MNVMRRLSGLCLLGSLCLVGCGEPEGSNQNQGPSNQNQNQEVVEVATPMLHASASEVLLGESVMLTPLFVGERAEIAPYFTDLVSGVPVEIQPTATETYTLQVFVGEASATAEVEVQVVEPATLHVVFEGAPATGGYAQVHGPRGLVGTSELEASYESLVPGDYTVVAPTTLTDALTFALVSPATVELAPGADATVVVDWNTVVAAPSLEILDPQTSYVVDFDDGLEIHFALSDLVDEPEDLQVIVQTDQELAPGALTLIGEGADRTLQAMGGVHYGDVSVLLRVRNTAGAETIVALDLHFAPWLVTSLEDDGPATLREAFSVGAEVIGFDEAIHGETIVLNSPLSVTSDLLVVGPGADQLILSGGGASGIFIVEDGVTLEVRGLTLREANRAVTVQPGGEFVVIETAFLDNEAVNGAAITNQGYSRVYRSLFVGNISDCGAGCGTGGGAVISFAPASGIEISDSLFSANIARSAGGASGSAIYHLHGSFSLIRSTVTENLCEGPFCGGGAVLLRDLFTDVPLHAEMMGNIIAGNVGGSFPDMRVIAPTSFSAQWSVHGEIEVPAGAVTDSVSATDPLLSPLGDYGGPFPTHVPLPGSPALELLPSTSDQLLDARGDLRRTGSPGSDAGAVERRAGDPN